MFGKKTEEKPIEVEEKKGEGNLKAKKTPKDSTTLVAIGSVALIILMVVVAIRPAIASVVEQINSNKQRQELIKVQETKLRDLKKLIEDETKYSEEIEVFKQAQPSFDDPEFISRNLMDYTQDRQNITIDSISFEYKNTDNTIQIGPDIMLADVALIVNCDVAGAHEFVSYLETFPRTMAIKSIKFSSNELGADDSTGLPLKGNIVFSVFWKQTLAQ